MGERPSSFSTTAEHRVAGGGPRLRFLVDDRLSRRGIARRGSGPSFRGTERGVATQATGRDRGSATVLVLGIVGVLLTLTIAAMTLLAVVCATHRAASAADLGALAGALHLSMGEDPGVACERARVLVAANGARLATCSVAADEVLIEVCARIPATMPGLPEEAQARARAGPAPEFGVPP